MEVVSSKLTKRKKDVPVVSVPLKEKRVGKSKADDIKPGVKKFKVEEKLDKEYLTDIDLIKDLGSTIMDDDTDMVLIHGPGGTGKTTFIRDFIKWMCKKHPKVCMRVTASTGIAAVNLLPKTEDSDDVYATTLHSWAGVGLCQDPVDELITEIKGHSKKFNRWWYTQILIIDEISMVGGTLFTILDHIGKDLRKGKSNSNKLFGGIKIIAIGDFLQLPPVKDIWVFESTPWKECNMIVYNMNEPKRYDNIDYFERLQRFRRAEADEDDLDFLRSKVLNPAQVKELLGDDPGSNIKVKPTVIHSTRADVEYKNYEELDKLPGDPYIFDAIDDFSKLKRKTKYVKEQHQKLLEDKFPSRVELKVGAQVMLRVNLDLECGLVNGSRGVVRNIIKCSNEVKTMSMATPIPLIDRTPETRFRVEVLWKNGLVTYVDNFMWSIRNEDGRSFRSQIPLTLAWAITSHKSQGCTLDYAVCDLGATIFSPGQFYVMLSRIKNEDGLFISFLDTDKIMADADALEYVDFLETDS